MAVPQKLKLGLLYVLAKPYLGIYPREYNSAYNRSTFTPLFIIVLFIMAKLWN
jgi:hypothetical protein